jgi:3-hydroxyacyl-[acyl-carrier-protein] dehydratase
MKKYQEIFAKLPYSDPFLFVEELISVTEDGVAATFTFDENSAFYKGHFVDRPVTPGVILTETMAQNGVACLGIFLVGNADVENIAMTSVNVEFLKPVFPGETVSIRSQKEYFRFGKLKCRVWMYNSREEEVCSGTICGMIL